MGYQFSFTKTRLFLLAAVSLLAALLIFAGGVATGKHTSGLKIPALPAVPAVPGQAALAKAAAPAVTPAPAAPVIASPQVAAAAPVTAAPATAAPAPAAAAPATVPVATAPAVPPVAVAVAVVNPGDQPFVLQVGAFRESKGAKDLQTDLQKKGYATTIYNMVDQDQRSWHMVRFGGYKDVATASKAASDFTGKEGIQALVKRFDSL